MPLAAVELPVVVEFRNIASLVFRHMRARGQKRGQEPARRFADPLAHFYWVTGFAEFFSRQTQGGQSLMKIYEPHAATIRFVRNRRGHMRGAFGEDGAKPNQQPAKHTRRNGIRRPLRCLLTATRFTDVDTLEDVGDLAFQIGDPVDNVNGLVPLPRRVSHLSHGEIVDRGRT